MEEAAPRAAWLFARDPRRPDRRSASVNTHEAVGLETPDAPRGLRPGHADSRNRSLDLHAAEAVVPRGHGASRPWMACARALEPRTAEPRDAPCPLGTAAPSEASYTAAVVAPFRCRSGSDKWHPRMRPAALSRLRGLLQPKPGSTRRGGRRPKGAWRKQAMDGLRSRVGATDGGAARCAVPPWDGGPVRSQLYRRCCCSIPMQIGERQMAPPDAACGLIQATRTPTTEAWIYTPRRPSSRGGMAQAGHGWPALARWSHGRRSRAIRRAPLGRRSRPKPAIPPLLLLRSDGDRGAMNDLTGTGKAAPWAAFFVAPDTCSPDSGAH